MGKSSNPDIVGCTMGLPRCRLVLIGAQILLSFVPALNALNINPLHLQDAADLNLGANSTLTSSCQRFLCVRDGSSSSNGVYPWLINNNNARFAYVRTDSEGYATYSYMRSYNGQTLTYYLHFYDEGVFYNGFWVVNDLETGYVETTGNLQLLADLLINILFFESSNNNTLIQSYKP